MIFFFNENRFYNTEYNFLLGSSYELKTDGGCTTDGKFKLIGGYQKRVDNKEDCETACSTYDWCKGYRINTKNTQCRLLTNDSTVKATAKAKGWDGLFNSNNWAEPDAWKVSTMYNTYKCYKKSS